MSISTLPPDRAEHAFYFSADDVTAWFADPKHPTLARFGRRLYEIDGGPSAPFNPDASLEAWRQFAHHMLAIHGYRLEPVHMPEALARLAGQPSIYRSAAVDVATIASSADPFSNHPWSAGPVTRAAVLKAIQHGHFCRRPIGNDAKRPYTHARRIAWLAVNPETWTPIELLW